MKRLLSAFLMLVLALPTIALVDSAEWASYTLFPDRGLDVEAANEVTLRIAASFA